jgi:hypothetical protein
MIKLFGSARPDHPMADPKEAKRILEELPAQDPIKALEELGHWHESVSQAEGFRPEQRIRLLLQIDDAAQARVKKITRDYQSPARLSRVQENRLWTAAHGYWRQAGLGLAHGVDLFVRGAKGAESAKSLLPQLLVRCLRALAQQIKWMHLRYGPYDLAVWGVFNRVYGYAEARNLAQSGVQGDTTPQLEYLRGLMFSASSPEGMLPVEIGLAEQVIAQLAPRCVLAATSAAELPYWVDIGQPMAPLRAVQPPAPAAGLRCFGAGAALEEVKSLADRIRATAAVPSTLDVDAPGGADQVLEVLEHLAMYWSPQPPERKHQRHNVKSRLNVTNGLQGVIETLGESASLSFDGSATESWIVENVSAGGFGAIVSQVKGDWLRVGALVAMQPEGGSNWVVGLVRRVNKTVGQQARVGIQTLSRSPAVSQFVISGSRGGTGEQGVLLKGNDPASAEVQIALRPGVFAPGQNLEATRGGRQHVYMPTAFGESGEDYEIGRFRELVRES